MYRVENLGQCLCESIAENLQRQNAGKCSGFGFQKGGRGLTIPTRHWLVTFNFYNLLELLQVDESI